jgi:hypothetical protein
MSAELKAKLAHVAARLAATQERLRSLERSAASVRHDLESLRTEVEQATDSGAAIDLDEFGRRVPTQPLAVGRFADGPGRGAAPDAAPVEPREAPAAGADAGPTAGEPWPAR